MSGPEDARTDPPDERPAADAHRLAIALQHDMAAGGAPTVVASGRGAFADALLDIAFAQGVRVREDADLAQLLSLVDVGDEIPVEAFLAVAEVLAFVYRANKDPRWAALLSGPSPSG